MTENLFLLSTSLSMERLSWIEECIKFFFVQLSPETLVPRAEDTGPVITFLVTGDALYSLDDPETQQVWSIILSLPAVQVICDREEMDRRGISGGHLKVKYPDQVVIPAVPGPEGTASFWNTVITIIRTTKPNTGTVGWLQYESPYMHASAAQGIRFLSAALSRQMSIELYACFDGVHIGHENQSPTDMENIGNAIQNLHDRSGLAGFPFPVLVSHHDATARGYSQADDGKGIVSSDCLQKPVRVRKLKEITDHFRQNHVILSTTSCNLRLGQGGAPSFDRAEKSSTAPPLILLITKSPYSTEVASGAVTFADACAHAGILTRVIFMEDGVFALGGKHRGTEPGSHQTIQDAINAMAGSENLHFFAFSPSLEKRGITKERTLNAVIDIGYSGLAKIFFFSPGNVRAEHQRILVF